VPQVRVRLLDANLGRGTFGMPGEHSPMSTGRRLQLPQCILKSSERSNKSRSLRRAWEFESAGDCGRPMAGDPGES